MKRNMNVADRIIRLVITAVFAILVFTGAVHGWVSILLSIIGIIFLLTSIFGFCPLYALFGIKTRTRQHEKI